MSLLAACILSIIGAQTPPDVSLSLEPTRVELALPKIQERIGQVLSFDKALRNEVLCIDVRNVSREALLEKIAYVAGAVWVEQKGGLRLVQDSLFMASQEKRRLLRNERLVSEALDLPRGWIKGMKRLDLVGAKRLATKKLVYTGAFSGGKYPSPNVQGPDPRLPAMRALYRLVLKIGAAKLSRQRPGRRVFALEPKHFQERLPAGSKAILDEFLFEQRLWAQAFRKSYAGRADSYEYKAQTALASQVPASARFLLVISGNRWDNHAVNLRIAAADGAVLLDAVTGISANYGKRRVPIVWAPGTEVPLHPDVRQFVHQLGASGDTWTPPSARLRDKLLHPEEIEPLSFTPASGLSALAGPLSTDIVANLADASLYTVYSLRGSVGGAFNNVVSANSLLTDLSSSNLIERKDGWLLIRPRWHEGDGGRTDRKGLGYALRALSNRGFLTLDQGAALSRAERSASYAFYFSMVGRVLNSENWRLGPHIRNIQGWYGTLTQAQRAELWSGRGLVIASMTRVQTDAFAEMTVFGNPSEIGLGLDSYPRTLERDMDFEPTEILASGFAADALAKAEEEEQPMLLYESEQQATSTVHVETFRRDPLFFSKASPFFVPVLRHQATLSVQLELTRDMRIAFSWYSLPFGPTPRRVEKLPERFR
ncbi:MAG: hypothetical protein WAO58_10810 [Fimbriimonadaceae bacterium]